MSGYIGVPLESDSDTLAEEALDTLMQEIPGWIPREGHLEVWMVEVWARMVAEARTVASSVPDTIFRYFGETLMDLPPVAAAAATTETTWTAIDTQGYTIPAGTVVAFRTSGDELVPFATVQEEVINPGSSQRTGVTVQAIDPGTEGNGLGPGDVELVDALAFVDSVTADAETSGGVDAESDEEYMDRLTAELQLLAPRPILPEDFAVLTRRVAGVERALAIDGYNPDDQTTDNERMVTVALVDLDGNPVSAAVSADTESFLDARREVNFIVHVIDPTYTQVDVTFDVRVFADHDLADVEARAEEAVTEYLDPATWGGGDESPPIWRATSDVVRYLEVAQVINEVDGVNYIESLTVNGGTSDVQLAGVAPLPSVGVIDGTVEYA